MRSRRPGRQWIRGGALVVAISALGVHPVQAQRTLQEAVEAARVAWLRHDYGGLVSSSDTVRLQLPGVGRAPALGPTHAASVLKEYLDAANEMDFELSRIRPASEEHAYAQFVRRYVVEGTSDERVETVFLGFRRVDDRWRLREVRITP